MKLFLTTILLFFAVSCHAQILELGYSPTSFKGWGSLPKTTLFNASLLFNISESQSMRYVPGVRYAYLKSSSLAFDKLGEGVKGTFNLFFLLPVSFNFLLDNIEIINRMGLGFSPKSFPNTNGLRINFLLEAGLGYKLTKNISLSVRYSHISNGFRGQTNPGVDNIILATEFYF